MLFSATMPHGVHDLALRMTNEALWIEATPPGTTAEGIDERFYSVKPDKKTDLLMSLIHEPGWEQVLIFTRTKAGADVLEGLLSREGIKVDAMHSNKQMKYRTRALERFAKGEIRVLVATDVAQRGLDVDGITHVVNYDVPLDPEDYVHRIGRTGRAGATGTAITFVTAVTWAPSRASSTALGVEWKRSTCLSTTMRVHLLRRDGRSGGVQRSRRGLEGGMGSKSASDLSPEELAKLLNPGS